MKLVGHELFTSNGILPRLEFVVHVAARLMLVVPMYLLILVVGELSKHLADVSSMFGIIAFFFGLPIALSAPVKRRLRDIEGPAFDEVAAGRVWFLLLLVPYLNLFLAIYLALKPSFSAKESGHKVQGSVSGQLSQLADLKNAGSLTESEFSEAKKKILER